MKKFKFSLDTVLTYKQQVLDSLQTEHAVAIAEVQKQREKLTHLQHSYRVYAEEYQTRCKEGMGIKDAIAYQAGLRAREREIEQEMGVLSNLQRKEEEKRNLVVEAKLETSSLEKLQEKKLNAYNTALAKSEEQFIEEFVSVRCNDANFQKC